MAGILALPLADALLPLLASLLLAGAAALGYLVGKTLERSPWPLFLIAQGVADVFVGTIRLVVTWAADGARNAASTMAAIFVNPYVVLLHAVWSVGDTAAALLNLRVVVIPFVAAQYAQTVFARVLQEVADRTEAVNALYWTAYNWVRGLYDFTTAGLAAAAADARQLYAAAISHADQVGAAAVAYTQEVGAAVEAHADQGDAAAEAFAQAIGAEALAYTQQVGAALTGDLELARRDLQGYTDAMGRATSAYAAALAAAVGAYAAARSDALAVAVQGIEDSPCQRFCAPLGGVGEWVQDLETAGLVAALVALAGESVHDPAGVAGGLIEAFSGPLRATADEVRQVAGV